MNWLAFGRRQRAETSSRQSFDAFISYNRALDGQLAPAIQSALHRFTKPWYRTRALRVFRDDASLSANPGLWPSIEQALVNSRFLVLLASPEAAGSRWVTQEAAYWCSHKPPSNILLVLTAGDLVWDEVAGDFDWTKTTALPSSLEGAFEDEPRFVDLRWARKEEHLSLHDPRFRDRMADLAAPLHGRAKDELFGEDVRQHRRMVRLARSAIASLAMLTVLAVTGAGVAVNRQRAAELQQRIATAQGLVAQADAGRDSDPRLALQLGIAAQRIHPDGETQASLVNTLTTTPYVAPLTGPSGAVTSIAFAHDGHTLATASDDHMVILWDLSDRTRPRRLGQPLTSNPGVVRSVAFAPNGHTLATGSDDSTGISGDSMVILWDLSDRTRPRRLGRPLTGHRGSVHSVAFAPNGRTLATGSDDSTVMLWDLSNRSRPRRLGRPLTGHQGIVRSVAFSPDGQALATASLESRVILWDLSDPARPRRHGRPLTGHHGPVHSVAFAPNGRTLATGTDDSTAMLWDLSSRSRPHRLSQPLTGHNKSGS